MMKGTMVGVRLPADLARGLELIEGVEQSDRSVTARRLLASAVRQWKLDHYARQYGEGRLSLARATRDAEVSLWEMMSHVRYLRIPAQYDLEDLQHDLTVVQASDDPARTSSSR